MIATCKIKRIKMYNMFNNNKVFTNDVYKIII